MSKKLRTGRNTNPTRKKGVTISTRQAQSLEGLGLRARLSQTDNLLQEINASINTNYKRERENYKQNKKLTKA